MDCSSPGLPVILQRTTSGSLLKLRSIESVMPFHHKYEGLCLWSVQVAFFTLKWTWIFQVTSVLGPTLILIPKFVHCQVASDWLTDLSKAVWLPPCGWNQQRSQSFRTYIQMFSNCFPMCTQLPWYFSISPKIQEIEMFPHTAVYTLSYSQYARWLFCLEEVSVYLEHSRQTVTLSFWAFFPLFFLCFFILSKDLHPRTTRNSCSWHELVVEQVGFIALCRDFSSWGATGISLRGFKKGFILEYGLVLGDMEESLRK